MNNASIPDPIARALAQVEREAEAAGNAADDGEGLGVLFSVQAECDVWKAAESNAEMYADAERWEALRTEIDAELRREG